MRDVSWTAGRENDVGSLADRLGQSAILNPVAMNSKLNVTTCSSTAPSRSEPCRSRCRKGKHSANSEALRRKHDWMCQRLRACGVRESATADILLPRSHLVTHTHTTHCWATATSVQKAMTRSSVVSSMHSSSCRVFCLGNKIKSCTCC
jgi:hypothetical protein